MKKIRLNLFVSTMIAAAITFGIASCGFRYPEMFCITLENKVGKRLEDVQIQVFDTNDNIVRTSITNESGECVFKLKSNDYKVKVSNLPDGYYVDKETYGINKANHDLKIVCSSEVIKESMPRDHIYSLGDIVYDFSFKNINNETVTLSNTLKEKDMVLINFWYIECSACIKEMPAMKQSYANRKDSIEIFGLDPIDNINEIKDFANTNDFYWQCGQDENNLRIPFLVSGYPTSIVIDRYGMITAIEKGSIVSESDFYELYDHFIGDDYQPVLANENGDFIDDPEGVMPPSKDIEKIVNGEGFDGTFWNEQDEEDAKLNWPWVISKDKKSVHPSNARHANSYSIMYTEVTLDENQVFAFDYFSSCEAGADILYILVDRNICQGITGESKEWETCFCYVPMEKGTHEVAFCYIKNGSGNYGDDTVYINNLRVISVDRIDRETYIFRYCSYGYDKENNAFTKYITPVYNPKDGYYHVNKEDGPLVMADLLNPTNWSGDSIYAYYGYGLDEDIKKEYKDKIVKYSKIIGEYASYQSNSVTSLVPVTNELKEALIATTKAISNEGENEWLEICGFYSAYCTNGVEMADPIIGLAPFSAYEGKLGENWVRFWDIVMPRGLMTVFVPLEDGVYKFQSIGDEFETTAWLYDENMNLLEEANQEARYYATCDKPDPNFAVYYNLEKGHKYYIRVAFEDIYVIGDLPFNISYIGDSYDLLTACAPGYFVPEIDKEGNIIAENLLTGGINVALGKDNYYHHLLDNGELGSIVYLEWDYPSLIFTNPMEEIINLKGFDMRYDEDGNETGTGRDYTSNILTYRNKVIHDGSELDGLVPVDRTLAQLLQLLMDKYTFKGVENSWLKLCYYYRHFGK